MSMGSCWWWTAVFRLFKSFIYFTKIVYFTKQGVLRPLFLYQTSMARHGFYMKSMAKACYNKTVSSRSINLEGYA